MQVSPAIAYARAGHKKFLAELMEFIRFPTISAEPKRAADIKNCAKWLANHLRRIGLDDARTIPTPRHPLVFASSRRAPGRPTLLIYGHYDVQPVDPLDQWRSPPFEPTVRGADLCAAPATTRGRCSPMSRRWRPICKTRPRRRSTSNACSKARKRSAARTSSTS
jgi:acetylornithine deacetylase/succinyl-diaminopimelate desuccinylase-like protein